MREGGAEKVSAPTQEEKARTQRRILYTLFLQFLTSWHTTHRQTYGTTASSSSIGGADDDL
jgi:hypothetical protein